METGSEVTLLQAMALLQSVIFSCIDRKKFPFTRTQISIFTALATEGEMTMKQIAKYISSSQEQATRAVAPLADAGYVARRTDPENRTRVHIRLTDQGHELLREHWGILKTNLSSKLEDSLDEDEQNTMYNALSTVIGLMEKIKQTDEKKAAAEKHLKTNV